MLYKALKGAASIPSNDLVPQLGMSESITLWYFKPPFHRLSEWNSLIDSLLVSAAEGAEASVAKFTSLVRARE